MHHAVSPNHGHPDNYYVRNREETIVNETVSIIVFAFAVAATGAWIVFECRRSYLNARTSSSASAAIRSGIYCAILTFVWLAVTFGGIQYFVYTLESKPPKSPEIQKRDADAVRDSLRIQ